MQGYAHRALRSLSCAPLGVPPWDPPSFPPYATLPSSCDVAIAGGGLTGLFLASMLARQGRDVVVLDHAFGAGASARSGGIVIGDTVAGPVDGFTDCEARLRAWIDAHEIPCELAWNGCLELVRNEALDPTPVDWRDGGCVRWIRTVNGGVLNPAQLLGGAAIDACDAGARLVNGVTAEALDGNGRGATVKTTVGVLSAAWLVMATDAMLAPHRGEACDPWEERGITVAIQTLPLEEADLIALGLSPRLAFYTDDAPLLWGRVMEDQSLIIGREMVPPMFDAPADALSSAVSAAGARMLKRTRALHRATRQLSLKRVWGGPTARTKAGVPAVTPDPGAARVLWVGGYGGHGIAQAFRIAELTADEILRRR